MPLLRTLAFLAALFSAAHAQVLREEASDLHQRGVERFFAGKINEAIADWDRAIALQPQRGPHHWQRGLALYYAGEYEKGVAQFVRHQTVNGNDVENAAWHFLCVVRAKGGSIAKARQNFIPIQGDTRVPMRQIHALYAGTGTAEAVLTAAKKNAVGLRLRDQLCYAHLYLGLYYEALDEEEQSRRHIEKAAVEFKRDHYMGQVAQLHHTLRSRPRKDQ